MSDQLRIHHISRHDACVKLGIDITDPDPYAGHRVVRNYELEDMLHCLFGSRWVVSEWCPFNYVFCQWLRHCPIDELHKEVERHREGSSLPPPDGPSHERLAAHIEEEITRREMATQEGGQA